MNIHEGKGKKTRVLGAHEKYRLNETVSTMRCEYPQHMFCLREISTFLIMQSYLKTRECFWLCTNIFHLFFACVDV